MARFTKHPDRAFSPAAKTPGLLDQNQQDYATQIVRAVSLQNRPPGHLDPTVSLGIQLDDWTAPEFWTLRRGTRWQVYHTLGGVAAQKAFTQVRGSPGMLTVLERVIITTNPGAVFIYGMSAADAPVGGGFVAVLDDRYYSAASPATQITSGNAVAPLTGNGGYVIIPAGVSTEVPLFGGVILTGKPNTAGVVPVWKVICQTLNQGFDITLHYRERPILDSER